MRPSHLISIAVHTPALTTAAMTLVRPVEAILITGGDVRTYTHILASVLMSGNITSQARLYTATECVSQPRSHRYGDDIFNVKEHNCHLRELALCLSRTFIAFQLHRFFLLNHYSQVFFLSFSLFLSFYNSVPEGIEPSLCVPLRGETAVKNILLFMSNFPSSHSPVQIKHTTFRVRERNSE